MAEAVFQNQVRKTTSSPKILHVDSAGTSSYNIGNDPDSRTMAILEDNGIMDYSHAARKVRSSDFTKFDYILAMDKDNIWDLRRLRQRLTANGGAAGSATIALFGDYGGTKGEEVLDPYYGALDGFELAYEQMVRFSNGFLKQVLGADVET